MPTRRSPNSSDVEVHDSSRDSLIRRSWHAMSDLISPFSPSALASLPKNPVPTLLANRSTRTDNIPETSDNGSTPNRSGVRDYNSINPASQVQVRVPKKISTPVQVEGKVWFANERTWVSYLNVAVLLGTLALALFNASKDQIARNFAYLYACISVGVVVYGYVVYQKRVTMIRKRDPGHFDQILGPVIIAALLFIAVLANFIIRVHEFKRSRSTTPDLNG